MIFARYLLFFPVFFGLTALESGAAKVKKYDDGIERRTVSKNSANRHFWRYSNCAVKRNMEGAKALLAHRDWGGKFGKEVAAYGKRYRSCLPNGSQMRFQSKLFRGSLAAAYLSQKYRKQTVPGYGSLPSVYTKTALSALSDKAGRGPFLLRAFADCVVRNQTQLAFTLFASKPTGKLEKEVFGQLQPTMGACLPVEDGDQVKFTATSLRGLMAEAAYDLEVRYVDDMATKIEDKSGNES